MFSEVLRTSQVARCNLLLYSLKNEASKLIRFFSDEKIFTVDTKINWRNVRWLAYNLEDIPVVAKMKFPANVHMLDVVSSEGDVMPHFFKKKKTVTKEVYLRILMNVMKPWMETVASGRSYVFQHDGTPVHTNHLIQN